MGHPVVCDDNCSSDLSSPTDNPSEDIVYNDSTEMSSFLPVGKQEQQKIEAVRNQLSENEPMDITYINEPMILLTVFKVLVFFVRMILPC